MARHHNANGLMFNAKIPNGQRGIIGSCGPCPDHHRVVTSAHRMDHTTRLCSGDPLAVPCRGRDTPVKTAGHLQRHERSALFCFEEETRQIPFCLFRKNARYNLNPCLAQHGKTLPRHTRVAVFHGGHNTGHA